jgi:hypothetical protein
MEMHAWGMFTRYPEIAEDGFDALWQSAVTSDLNQQQLLLREI